MTNRYSHQGIDFEVVNTTPGRGWRRWRATAVDGSREACGDTMKEVIAGMRKLIEAGDDHDILYIADSLRSHVRSHTRWDPKPQSTHEWQQRQQQLLDRVYRRVSAIIKCDYSASIKAEKLDKLRNMTVANGCTRAEEEIAQAMIKKAGA
jgi:hypothetical protein